MKHLKKVALIGLLVFGFTNSYAKAKIPFGKKEVITIVSELPDNEMYETSEGSKEYLELATLHEEFNIAWILPLWITQEPKLVLYNEKSDTYYDATEEEMNKILAENKIKREDVLKVPFYNKYGGKMIVFILIGLIIWSYVGKKDDNDVEPKEV